MQCETCQQNNMVAIKGKNFCANCGKQAQQRLQDFRPNPSPQQPANVLDLNQPAQPRSAAEQPNKSLHGMHARRFHGSAAAQEKAPPAAPPPNVDPENAGSGTENVPPAPQTAPPPPPPEPETPPVATAETTPAVPMEPHQVYPLKGDSTAYTNGALNNDQYFADPELPAVGSNGFPESSPGEPKKRSWLAGLRILNPFNKTAIRAGTIGLCIVLLAGYVTYLNYPNLAVRVAASRANIDATMPKYTPKGYDFNGPVSYGQGQLTITFEHQGNTIALSQAKTQWDSQSLLKNYVNYQTSQYDTYRENGLTIYTYDNQHAAWVNGGVLYKIESDNYLSQTDIVKMASSM